MKTLFKKIEISRTHYLEFVYKNFNKNYEAKKL